MHLYAVVKSNEAPVEGRQKSVGCLILVLDYH